MSLQLPGNERFWRRGLRGLWELLLELLSLLLVVAIIAAFAASIWFAFARENEAVRRCYAADGVPIQPRTGDLVCVRRNATVPGGTP